MKNKMLSLMTKRNIKGTSFSSIKPTFPNNKDVGMYIHIPFCKSLCPFCPYNRYLYKKEKEKTYVNAVKREIDMYRKILSCDIDTLYVGGGTPTVMMDGLIDILDYAQNSFNVKGNICVEANPDDINDETLNMLIDSNVKKISIGVQSFNNDILKNIGRKSHNREIAFNALKLTLEKNFDCVNVDFMFNLPSQDISDLNQDLKMAVELGVHQVTTYPLLLFRYTKMYKDVKNGKIKILNKEKKMYNEIVDFMSSTDYNQCTVWGFAKNNVEKYGSVEREEYVGVGAGAMSVTNECSYSNTFSVDEYIKCVNKKLPIATGTTFSKKSSMMHWVMMRLYELGFNKSDFVEQFDVDPETLPALKWLKRLGIIKISNGFVSVTKKGLYPIHLMTKTFLSTYISRICEEGLKNPWPDEFKI